MLALVDVFCVRVADDRGRGKPAAAALRQDEHHRAIVIAPVEGKLKAVRVKSAVAGMTSSSVVVDDALGSVALVFEDAETCTRWLEALRRAAAPAGSRTRGPPRPDVVSLALDCEGVPRARRKRLAAALRESVAAADARQVYTAPVARRPSSVRLPSQHVPFL